MKNNLKKLLVLVLVLLVTVSMIQIGTKAEAKKTFVIGMSQCNLGEPWRVAMNDQIAMAAAQHPEFQVIYADAAQDNSKQIADIQNFIQSKVDLIIASTVVILIRAIVIRRMDVCRIPTIVTIVRVYGWVITPETIVLASRLIATDSRHKLTMRIQTEVMRHAL